MTKTLDFYFDFMSPFAYLAYQRLPALVREFGLELRLNVIDLPAAKKAAGNTGPRNVDIPAKIRYLKVDLERWAQRYAVPLVFPPSLDSARLNKGVFHALDRGAGPAYVDAAWHAVWGTGADMNDPALFERIAESLGWDEADLLSFVDSTEAEARYAAANRAAHERGVFGVPTMMVDDQMWWGNDRLEFMREYLTQREG
ncbi:2-hydroxychromene-2-carboxylate isomerase [Pinisolibacter aquiterrae]|uniref:2-hydroxychromene-2-carboxylate isomerase n=1 Tax=Pinisolibacter aquiterrae TaxID=2815579 RepID=UPI001C3E455B|nr:2-hydroxychromene-2-carboxylate isomerase [Pinisolibacter aquiterrae]MBV5265025.1 2-hydroxychromene-2-carboxylate isomerase [Pinisolibacter aquiterrae]MCC8235593.1 2-hydroxychromene-2-carboxylate isomerase [Pinisolibacter aquiterrae]